MVVLLEGSPISTEELCQSDHWVLSHLPDQSRVASSRKSLGGSKLPFKNDGHCVLGGPPMLVPFPRSVPQHTPVSELYGQFLRPHGLVFALTCTVNCGTLNRQMCAFPSMSFQLNLPHVNSNQVVETSQK